MFGSAQYTYLQAGSTAVQEAEADVLPCEEALTPRSRYFCTVIRAFPMASSLPFATSRTTAAMVCTLSLCLACQLQWLPVLAQNLSLSTVPLLLLSLLRLPILILHIAARLAKSGLSMLFCSESTFRRSNLHRGSEAQAVKATSLASLVDCLVKLGGVADAQATIHQRLPSQVLQCRSGGCLLGLEVGDVLWGGGGGGGEGGAVRRTQATAHAVPAHPHRHYTWRRHQATKVWDAGPSHLHQHVTLCQVFVSGVAATLAPTLQCSVGC